MNELALFAGAGGGILGGTILGWRTVCAVEVDAYARSVLLARQRDELLPVFPIWDDVCTFDGLPWRGHVDVVSGGFPCQDISSAGKGAGLDGERSGLWLEMARIIGEVQPEFAFVENSPVLTSRGLDRVLGDLAEMGFDARWGVLGADDVGAPHKRERIWIVAHAMRNRREANNRREPLPDADRNGAAYAAGRKEQQPRLGCTSDVADTRCSHGQRRTDEQDAADREATERHEAADNAQRCGEVATVPDTTGEGRAQPERAGETLLGTGAGELAGQDGGGRNPWFPEPDVLGVGSVRLHPHENKFHAGNGEDGKHYWLTPPALFAELDAEFGFDFDPCPYPKPESFDGLTCEWGARNYVNPPFGSIIHQGRKKGPTAWMRKAIEEQRKGKLSVVVYPVDKWVLMMMAAIGAQNIRNLGDVKWCATEDGSAGKGTGRHIACFVLTPNVELTGSGQVHRPESSEQSERG